MPHTLIVGCSYVEMLSPFPTNNPNHNKNHPEHKLFDAIDHDNFLIVGRAGSGNTGIAARVIYECSKQKFDQVVVLWSGINRIDIPVPARLQQTFPRRDQHTWVYDYITELDDVVWYHSGGWGASGVSQDCPQVIREFFRNQYLGATSKYLTDLSLQSVVNTQTFLKANNIEYKMGWMYNIHEPTSDNIMFSGAGHVDTNSRYYSLVDWSKINTTSCFAHFISFRVRNTLSISEQPFWNRPCHFQQLN